MPSSAQTLWEHLAALLNDLPPAERQRFQGELARFAHDLRQSLGNIIGAETLLRRSLPESDPRLELLDVIHTASQRAVRLVTDMAQPFDSDQTMPFGHGPGGG